MQTQLNESTPLGFVYICCPPDNGRLLSACIYFQLIVVIKLPGAIVTLVFSTLLAHLSTLLPNAVLLVGLQSANGKH